MGRLGQGGIASIAPRSPGRSSFLHQLLYFLVLVLLRVPAGAAEDNAPERPDLTQVDKSAYHLFNPTPRQFLRELTTDRPDKTESPYTVDAGHFQFEMDLVNYVHDREQSGGLTADIQAWAVAPINIKVGLLNRVDLQLIVESYQHLEVKDGPTRQTRQGFGDMIGRLKLNLWGDDGGPTAMGVMPYLKLPTNQDGLGNNGVEGGLILPFACSLPGGFDLGVMTQLDVARDLDGEGYHPESVNSITVGHDLIGALAGYAEFWSSVSAQRHSPWEGSVDVGLTYGLTQNVQIDAGINIGVTRSADDWNPFLGFSWRF